MPKFQKNEGKIEIKKQRGRWRSVDSSGGAIYGIGIIGVAVYYVVHATSFWMGVLGVVKAIFWPGFLLFKVFELLKM